ncbi:hypothetical protein [Desertivirga arenae]|uniref:hypothetical protein n=1 Tax=Desertivirga arenae TaxID=2810309 RepID=UPI001A957D02|nr:hypothetical protein [Pedobacter sp. SYSU D00823]
MKTLKRLGKAEIWMAAVLITINIIFGGGETAYAQTSVPDRVEVNINTNDGGWYAQPWVWIVGIALFIIVVIAITRAGSREF